MKKLLSILLCALLVFAMASCNTPSGDETTDKNDVITTEEKKAETTEKKEETTEKKVETTEKKEETTEKKVETTEKKVETTEEEKDNILETKTTLKFDADTASVDHSADYGYKWDKDNLTLTLCGLKLTSDNGVGIEIGCAATIEIADSTYSTIDVTGQKDLGSHGILSTEALTFIGGGILAITAGDYEADVVDTGITAYGICAKSKTVELNGPTINIVCGTIGDNLANLRNIQGIRCHDLIIKNGNLDIQTGDCFTTTKGAFLDGIYATGAYQQFGGNVKVLIGYCHIIGDELFRENVALCIDGSITVAGGTLEAEASLIDLGKALVCPSINFGEGTIQAGGNNQGRDTTYTNQLYLKVTY